MSETNTIATFCEGCPFANGVVEATGATQNMQMAYPNSGFEVRLKDNDGNKTEAVRAIPVGDIGTDMPQNVIDKIKNRVGGCEQPVETQRGRIGRLAGMKAVVRCGAFPDQNPKNITTAVTTFIGGW